MNVTINFSEEIEMALRRTAAAAGKDVGTFVQQIITERLEEPEADQKVQSPEVFAEKKSVTLFHFCRRCFLRNWSIHLFMAMR